MESSFLSKLHIAIKEDDVKAFDKLITQKLLALCLGRFPILSLCYMYQSTLILSKYEKQLLNVTSASFINENEPIAIYGDFKEIAGKSLRFFSVGFVSPAEMLAVMGLSDKLNYEWKDLEKNSLIIANVQKIYQINYGLECKADEESISAPKIKGKAHSSDILLKFFIVTACIIFLFSGILGVTLGLFGTGSSAIPLKVHSLDIFKKNVTNAIILENDFDLRGLSFGKVGIIKGNNKKIILDSLNVFDTLEGELSDLTIELNLDVRIIEIENALIKVNNGTIKNVTIIVNGKITEENLTSDLLVSTLVGTNNGKIENTKVQGAITLVGNARGNASFSAFACVNNGLIKNCELSNGSIESESVDLAGFVIENNGTIENVRNNQPINHKTTIELFGDNSWSPNCAGIVLTNNGSIKNAENNGKIQGSSEVSKFAQIILAGIVTTNYGTIENSTNNADIEATSKNCSAYVGGIATFNYSQYSDTEKLVKPSFITECVNKGNITISNTCVEKTELVSGGIAMINEGTIQTSDNFGKISTTTNSGLVYSAGVVAINSIFDYDVGYSYANVRECKSETDIEANVQNVLDSTINLFGGIVARNQGYLTSSFAFTKFSLNVPERKVEESDSDEENTSVLPTYFAGSVVGLAYVTLNPTGGLVSTTNNNYGYFELDTVKPVGMFAYNNSLISNVNDTLNFGYTDKEAMIKKLTQKGLYR